jgi:Flp pilus assembly protein TadG
MKERLISKRKGAIAPLTAVLMVPLMGMAALSVDFGYLTLVQYQLQNAADAGALAGVAQLTSVRSQLKGGAISGSDLAAVSSMAQTFASLNKAGGATLAVPASDLAVGYLANPSDFTSTMTTNTTSYNAVQVTTRRSATANGAVPLFFAGVLGKKSFELKATATASVDLNIQGFKLSSGTSTSTGQTSKLLPFALKVTDWDAVTAGSGPDIWSYNPTTKAVTSGSDGIHEVKLFPAKNLTAGNFGTVDIGSSSNSTADIVRQILYGPNQTDFDYLGGQLALGANGTVTLQGDTGLSVGFKDALTSIIGQPRVIPLFSSETGAGNNAKFTIVGFAGIIITKVQLTGLAKSVTIQPEFVVDSTAFGGGPSTSKRFVSHGVALSR